MFMESELTETHKEWLESIMNQILDKMIEDISAVRGISKEKLCQVFSDGSKHLQCWISFISLVFSMNAYVSSFIRLTEHCVCLQSNSLCSLILWTLTLNTGSWRGSKQPLFLANISFLAWMSLLAMQIEQLELQCGCDILFSWRFLEGWCRNWCLGSERQISCLQINSEECILFFF